MNKNALWTIVAIIILLVIGFLIWGNTNEDDVDTAVSDSTTQTQQQVPIQNSPETLSVMVAAQNSSGEKGTALINEVDGKAHVVLTMTGAPKDALQPAQIRSGTCASLGAVKYPLMNAVNGRSESTLDISVAAVMLNAPLAISVQKSAAEPNVYVACADLTPSTNNPS